MAPNSSGKTSADPMIVEMTVLNLAGEPLVVNLPEDSSVLEVKREVAKQCGHLVEMQQLLYEEQALIEDQRLLREFGFGQKVAITLVLQCLDVDKYIQKLRGNESFTEKEDIKLLCHSLKDIFLKEPSMLDLQPPVVIAGALTGYAEQLNYILDTFGEVPASQYLFLGNYVSHGKRSVDTLTLLLLYKKKHPERIHLLRGKNESESISKRYGFYDECKRNFNVLTWKTFLTVFNTMPICALIHERILCVPSGLSRDVHRMDQLRNIEKTDSDREGPVSDLLWSRFDETIQGLSFQCDSFGPDFLEDFLQKNQLEMVICSPGLTQDGHLSLHGGKLVTVYSISNYMGECNNRGAVLLMDEQLQWKAADYFI